MENFDVFEWDSLVMHKHAVEDEARSVVSQAASQVSKTSSKSARSEMALKRARLAVLKKEMSFQARERELELRRVEHEREIKQLRNEKEMAILEAEITCLEEEETDLVVASPSYASPEAQPSANLEQPMPSQGQFNTPPVDPVCTVNSKVFNLPINSSMLNPHAPPFESKETWSTEFNGACSLIESLKIMNMPKIELRKFSGDPLSFSEWMTSFEKLVEDMTSDPARRLHYLRQYTEGIAHVLVSGYVSDQSHESYQAAKTELIRAYGRPTVLARAFIKKLEDWPLIRLNDSSAMEALLAFLKQCKGAMISLSHLEQLNTDLYMQKVVKKFPVQVQVAWVREVEKLESKGERVSFGKLVQFTEVQARMMNHPVFSISSLAEKGDRKEESSKFREGFKSNDKGKPASHDRKHHVMTTSVTEITPVQDTTIKKGVVCCFKCSSEQHKLNDCFEFLQMSVKDRKQFVKDKNLCFTCLSRGHAAKLCRKRLTCRTCSKIHPTSLHDPALAERSMLKDKPVVSGSSDYSNVLACTTATANPRMDLMAINVVKVDVYHESDPQRKQTVYAALDSLSSSCFVTERVWRYLNCSATATELSIRTINEERLINTHLIAGLKVMPCSGGETICLPKVIVQKDLPFRQEEIPSHEALRRWPHLERLTDVIPERDPKISVEMLIGVDCPLALEPLEVIRSQDDGPYAYRTALGWCISGPMYKDETNHVESRRGSSASCLRSVAICRERSESEMEIKTMLQQLYENDFNEPTSLELSRPMHSLNPVMLRNTLQMNENSISGEDLKFVKTMTQEIKLIEGRYQVPLPFRSAEAKMPNNRSQVLERLQGLKVKFKKNDDYKKQYTDFMNSIIDKGYARKASSDKAEWYLPHHGVYHPCKPGKIRVVFDCSCCYQGKSLNKEIMSGPNLTNSIVGVLLRFRQERVAVAADIESMFYQVRVPDEQRKYLRFLWWTGGDETAEPEEYEMCVHLFGCISSPSCSNFVLKKLADVNEIQFGTEAAESIRRNFYVDDFLKSTEDATTAITLVRKVSEICSTGGFHLTKFISTHKEVLDCIPNEDKAKVSNMEFTATESLTTMVLGIQWYIESDTLGFRIQLSDGLLTRRKMLSTVSSIYDPLGLVSPFLLHGRSLLQETFTGSDEWDEPVPDDVQFGWEKWKTNLLQLQNLQLQRCFKPPDCGKICSISLHHFSDASQKGYGHCSYIRFVDDNDRVFCSLLMAKSRVTPKKMVSIPRLELMAATVSTKVGCLLRQELEYKEITETFWTDSKVVLGYINNEAKRFQLFVANRVQLIRENTSIADWHYISTADNPADDASRGINHLVTSTHRWFRGPEFLWQKIEKGEEPTFILDEKDPEVRKVKRVLRIAVEEVDDLVYELEEKFSDWFHFKKLFALCLRFVHNIQNRDKQSGELTVEELHKAETRIIKSTQRRAFKKELEQLICNDAQLPRSSRLRSLDPFISSDGLLRVGGRLRRSALDESLKHPILLPNRGRVTELIVNWCHERVKHGGRGFTLNEIRSQGFWVIKGNSVVRKLIYQCVRCRYARGKPGEQRMADLPKDRLEPAPPFTYVGVDFFGPFLIKERRSELKRYGCLFTCLACRAIHIEVANSLSTDSFINALRRFMSRRGPIRQLRSDQGTNFVGAETELKAALKEMDVKRIQRLLLAHGGDFIVFKRNPPTASHMGGVWERQIRTVRAVLTPILKQNGRVLDEECFRTVMTEVEAIVNSRPLTVETLSDATSLKPISPNQLLTTKSTEVCPPPGVFEDEDLYSRKQWRRVQRLAELFWSRWEKEYLSSLQPRKGDTAKKRNFQVGDVVLVKEELSFRNDWPIARVVETHIDDQECVRSVMLLMSRDIYKDKKTYKERPIHKLVLLLEAGR